MFSKSPKPWESTGHHWLMLMILLLVPASAIAQESDPPGNRPQDPQTDKTTRPNVLFAIADDWGWPHAGSYQDPVVKTPTFDRLAEQGILFHQAFVSSPSCTPSRGAILSGMYHWQLGPSANLYGPFPDRVPTYPELLKKAGYRIGKTSKCWGPGVPETRGRQLGGPNFASFQDFLDAAPDNSNAPFCFWLGSGDPHRPYQRGSGKASGIPLEQIQLPACFPDNATVRGDVADYYVEVQRFDKLVGNAVQLLEERGMLDQTIIVMTGDHGMPFPRCKANLYDTGTRVPLAIRYPLYIQGGSETSALVSLTDLAPTFLELAGLEPTPEMTGRSLMDVLRGGRDTERLSVVFGKERHVPCQEAPNPGGYPCRGLRTDGFLYIRNYFPDRWPNGTPDWQDAWFDGSWLGDTDNGPTKTVISDLDRQNAFYQWSFAKRPAEELYDLTRDPDQLNNVADNPRYQETRDLLRAQLADEQKRTGDPRAANPASDLDRYQPYTGGSPLHPEFGQQKAKDRP